MVDDSLPLAESEGPLAQCDAATHRRGRGRLSLACIAGLLLAACASRSIDVRPVSVATAEFAHWDCERIQDELDRVQRDARDVAYAVDERAGNNLIVLGIGAAAFWPALLALRPDGPEAAELAQLKGRDEALREAARGRACPPPPVQMSAGRAALLPVAPGERLVYVDLAQPGRPSRRLTMTILALRRTEVEIGFERSGAERGVVRQDLSGNALEAAPFGLLHWQRLLRPDLALGQRLAGRMLPADDAMADVPVRGRVVAVGPQTVAGRRFDAAVVELSAQVARAEGSARVDGVLVVDRGSGILLRLDLDSADPEFALRRRLVSVEPAG